jgi:hypothetical protein
LEKSDLGIDGLQNLEFEKDPWKSEILGWRKSWGLSSVGGPAKAEIEK